MKVMRRMILSRMKEPRSYPLLLGQNSLGLALGMAVMVGTPNLADTIQSDGLRANPHQEVGRGPYSTS
jgi:hypothetical protein